MAQEPQAASDTTVSAFTALDEGKQRDILGKLSDSAKQALLMGIRARKSAPDPFTAQTQAVAKAAGIERPGVSGIKGNPSQEFLGEGKAGQPAPRPVVPPGAADIERAGQRANRLAQLEGRATRSPTPFSNAMAVLAPVAAARQVVGAKAGAYVGRKAAPLVGVSPEAGEFAGSAAGSLLAGAAPKAVETPMPSVKLRRSFKLGPFDIKSNAPVNPYEEMGESAQYQGMAKDATRQIPPPPDPEYVKAKTITEAQESAQAENAKRTAATARDTQKLAAAHEAAYNKEAGEHMAIQKRLDAETSAQAAAEQAARAHGEKLGKQRLAADAAQTQYYDELEKARVAEVDAKARLEQARVAGLEKQIEQAKKDAVRAATDRHRMNTMYGDDLMKRGRETKELEAEAERLAGEVEKAATKAANSKRELALRATNMQKLRVARAEAEALAGGPASVSPEVWKALTPMDKARIIARYENTKSRASEQGMVHAGRGATGPQLSNEAIRLPRPPEP